MTRGPAAAAGLAIVLAVSACGASIDQGRSTGTVAPVEAAKSTFCSDLSSFVEVLDRYGRLFAEDEVTVGQVQSGATELGAAHDRVKASSTQLADSITAANRAATTPPGSGGTTTTLLAAKSADEHLETITDAEKNLRDASTGIGASTPVHEATAELQAAALGVEQAYVSLFVDAGCLQDDAAAARSVNAYVKGLQEDLVALGHYTGPVDGLYGPATVAAIKALQTSAGLPQTGIVDQATEMALVEQLAAKAEQSSLNVAALQGALTATGDYTGPIDGRWTPELESAVVSYQNDQGLPATGEIDPDTLASLLRAGAPTDGSTTTTSASPDPSPSTPAPAKPSTTIAPSTPGP